MKSIAARLAVWYALAATLTIAALSVAAYFTLQKQLIAGLDALTSAQFQQLKARLGPDYERLSANDIEQRIRETTEYASVMFYIDIHDADAGVVFRSSNLRGRTIPDLRGQRVFNVTVDGIGELRTGEFLMAPYDVMIATPLKPVRDATRDYAQLGIATVTVTLLISLAIGFGLSHFALRPVRLIERTAERISLNNLGERIQVENVDDELENLARLLNQMFDRLEASFAEIRRFTADASHELKTPLSLIRLQAERMVNDGGLTGAQEESVHGQLEEVTRLNALIEEMLLISRAESRAIEMDRQPRKVAEFLHSFAQDARALAEHRGVQYTEDSDADRDVSFDARWLRQVLLNLLSNAIRVAPAGSVITLQSRVVNGFWRASIADHGPGVPADQRQRIFERFVRLETGTRSGTGLGLAICRSIIELHDGRIWAEATDPAQETSGLRVVFEIPILPRVATQPKSATTGAATSRKHQQRYAD